MTPLINKSNSKQHWNYLLTAYNIAQKSTYPKKYGAVLVYQNKIISTGFNSYKKGAFTSGKKTLHAEIDAILQLQYNSKMSLEKRRQLRGVNLYVVKCSNMYNGFENCQLCHDCQIKIKKLMKLKFINKVFLSSETVFD